MADKVFDMTVTVKQWHDRQPQMDIWKRVVNELTSKFQANLNYYKGASTFRVVMEVEKLDD